MSTEMPFLDVPVERVMTPEPATVEPEASLADAAEALLQGGFRHLPVVSADGRPVGIISERDVRASLGTDLYGFTRATLEALAEQVSGVMTPDPIVVRMDARLGEALETFADERVGAILVVDEAEKLRGILSYVDVLLWLRDALETEAEPPLPRAARRPARPEAPSRPTGRPARKRPRKPARKRARRQARSGARPRARGR
jgi:acetoin utilization protein AcuB